MSRATEEIVCLSQQSGWMVCWLSTFGLGPVVDFQLVWPIDLLTRWALRQLSSTLMQGMCDRGPVCILEEMK